MAEETTMTLVQKLAKIREMTEVLRKNKSGFNYKYVTEDEILARVAAGMKRYGVSLKPSITPATLSLTPVHYTKNKKDKAGNLITEEVYETIVNAELTFTWINCDNETDTMDVPWVLVGQQADAAQALGSALTYANRYFMLKFFQIATPDDDPDSWRNKKEDAEAEADAAITRELVSKIDDHVHAYLDLKDNSDEARKKLTDIIKKHVRNGSKPSTDYTNYLTDHTVAAKLLEELTAQCPIE